MDKVSTTRRFSTLLRGGHRRDQFEFLLRARSLVLICLASIVGATAASAQVAFCDPGVGGVIPCPCSNPPSGPGRGCDNSTPTGGASIAAAGVASVTPALDTLVFTATFVRPGATTVLIQGDVAVPGGLTMGMGIRCLTGHLRRLYQKPAVGGTATMPDLGTGDPDVWTRSAATGDPIAPATHRYYAAYYRDPVVLGGCPANATSNMSPALDVTWIP